MMLIKHIEEDFIRAMKEHDVGRVKVLRLLKAAIGKAVIAARTSVKQELDESDVESVVRQEIKKTKDALVDFSRAARRDLEEEAKAEIGILSGYLPKGMEPSELKSLVAEMVTKLKAEGVAEFGKVMGRVMKEVKGRADGETVAEAVREALESK
ncbi:hypothetical protein A3H10_03715 [Candidatus Uhrbacteria bacterium RIFCSPLOWO2_12_FULL_46_10]|uniref:Glutamyl-tRNA amidotransferase n=1 Tax=Candidatus Uhrbacteria bacterium RIFCSPLOWO2_01_FULL_47_25 TaxID=1802402 RepID=A0A1F7UTX1_9BACT|nr:MAG: hypothetical protein A2752_04755 [Candidatus Uhrbacteria bacterium RIFCSPHIGHO2_01_FULL_46_23]OGL69357.1 MAG: hypothetical protein A3D60_05520 [Candidatus Uhrbacteria bacterium RIFCSPHIGHO2_02_FULL_47_29]OGL74992.1 MAG: hypothetical protein A3E96_02600 [Candidatus Uhrbacteria bacterium RIFCSPHIGHO2_12_FULL_46_13]OGL81741.1 MAG: hypothetical protein A2936_04970 [Candidatus Uhrbacteria bacterium RIFCSPLOWO2_01_FULL_47_25]OGL85839.1 MAG: hypothetical protein A3I37_02975 [Candidatus Uhrbact